MDYTNKSESEIKNWLKENLNEERYLHSLGTADCARELAKMFFQEEEKAYIAGLLHDAAKCFDKSKLLKIIDENIKIEEEEQSNYKTLHAPVSAFVAEHDFGVKDKEILSAIRWHTIGKVNMTVFEKIIFLADKIEPNTRDEQWANYIQDLLKEDKGLDKALLACYKATIKSLVDRNLKICTPTVDIYNNLEDLTAN